jgi:polyisoprenoid-binding protein YceI
MAFQKLMFAAVVASSALGLESTSRGAEPYTVDPVHSSVHFRVKHMDTSFAYGRFNDLAGQFALNDSDPSQSRFDFQVKTASIDTANANRDQHLKGNDFFNAVQYPTIAFRSKSVSKTAPDTYQANGDLTLHGVTRPLTVTIKKTGSGHDMQKRPIVGFETKFTIKRSEFKMGNMVGPIGDEVGVMVSVEGVHAP